MPAQALIINADDLGLWPAVDRGILHAWSARAVSDSTIFANAPQLADTLAAARQAGLPVGLHLNLTLGAPLADPAEIPALVTAEGIFMKRGLWTRPLPAEQVRAELRRQVQRCCDLGGQPSHLDSHHHIHRYPEVFAVVLEIAAERGLPVRAVDADMRGALRAAGLPTPDHFTMAFYGAAATVDTLIAQADACPGGVLEIMTHPGCAGDDIPSSYRAERAQELAALTAPQWQSYLQARAIPLIGYRALRR